MKDPRTRWKATGVAVGAAALMTVPSGSAQAAAPAAHLAPDASSWSVARELNVAWTAAQQEQLRLAQERYLGFLGNAVASLEARAVALGAPAKLTPRQAAKFRATIAAASFVQRRLTALATAGASTLTASDQATIASLKARAATVASEVRAALANASIVRPDATPKAVTADLADKDDDGDHDGRLCDHDGFRDASFRDGAWSDRSWGDRSWSYGDHHRFRR